MFLVQVTHKQFFNYIVVVQQIGVCVCVCVCVCVRAHARAYNQ